VSDGEDGEEIEDPCPWHELAYNAADKMRRAQARLIEIDRALRAFGYDPEQCGFGRPVPH
jgi:hypothetical protein